MSINKRGLGLQHKYRKKLYGGTPPHDNKYRHRCKFCQRAIHGDDERRYDPPGIAPLGAGGEPVCMDCARKRGML